MSTAILSGFCQDCSTAEPSPQKGGDTAVRPLYSEQVTAFDTILGALLNPPILAVPRFEGAFTLDIDASNHQLGYCLLQSQPDGSQRPVGYWSRRLTSAKKNYSTTEKECLAIVCAILHIRPYLEQQKFTIRTDCSKVNPRA
jgi:hypothetical protein